MEQLQEALVAIDTGNVEKGLEILERLEKEADDETKFLIAETYYQLGHIQNAKKIIDDLLVLYPKDGELLTFTAELLIDLDQEDEAIMLLTEVEENDPAFAQAQLLLADLYQLQGLDEVAEQKLLIASKHIPDEPVISFGLGEFYLGRGDYQKSVPYFKKVMQQDKEQRFKGTIDLRLAEAYSGIGEFETALKYYETGLKEKTELSALFGYGYTAFQLERYELAIDQFNKLKHLDPQYTSLYPYLAKAYEACHLLDEALQALKEGMAFDEYNESLYVHAGKLCFKMQNPDDGEAFFKRVIDMNPSYFEAVSTYAAYLKHEERYEDLLELIKKFKETEEVDPLLTWYEAVSHHKLEQYEQAKECFEDVYRYFVNDVDFLEDYGIFMLEYGNKEMAGKLFQQVIKLDPEKQNIRELIDHLEFLE